MAVQAAEDFAARAAAVYAAGVLRGVRATLSAINRTQPDSGIAAQTTTPPHKSEGKKE